MEKISIKEMNVVLTSRNTRRTNEPENDFAVLLKITSSEVLGRERNGEEMGNPSCTGQEWQGGWRRLQKQGAAPVSSSARSPLQNWALQRGKLGRECAPWLGTLARARPVPATPRMEGSI